MPNEEYLDESLRKIAKGAGIGFTGTFIGTALGYFSRMIIARFLGSSDYGLISLGFAAMMIVATLSSVGYNAGIQRFVSFYKGKEDEGRIKGTILGALKICFPLSLILTLLIFFYADWISIHVFHSSELIPVLRIFVIGVPFWVLATKFVIEEAVASGIEDIIIITGRGKRAIEDYFDTSPELENHLLQNEKYELLREVKDISSLVDIHYIRQKEPKGLGDAVLKAEKHIGDEPFAVLLGDDIIKAEIPCIKQLMNLFDKYKHSIIAVEEVPKEKIRDYGIIKGREIEESIYYIEDIIEKPSLEEAPSNIGTVGRYVLTPEIFNCIKETPPGKGNEIQLTDAIRMLKEEEDVYGYTFKGKRYDAGDKAGYVKAIIDFALGREDLKEEIGKYLQEKR